MFAEIHERSAHKDAVDEERGREARIAAAGPEIHGEGHAEVNRRHGRDGVRLAERFGQRAVRVAAEFGTHVVHDSDDIETSHFPGKPGWVRREQEKYEQAEPHRPGYHGDVAAEEV